MGVVCGGRASPSKFLVIPERSPRVPSRAKKATKDARSRKPKLVLPACGLATIIRRRDCPTRLWDRKLTTSSRHHSRPGPAMPTTPVFDDFHAATQLHPDIKKLKLVRWDKPGHAGCRLFHFLGVFNPGLFDSKDTYERCLDAGGLSLGDFGDASPLFLNYDDHELMSDCFGQT